MHIITDLKSIPPLPSPIGLTIGTFDGMHLGHQALLRHLQQRTAGGAQAVFTFSNHPSGKPQLCTLEHKLEQLQRFGIALVLLFTFGPEFARQPFDLFLTHLHQRLPFSYLILGEDAAFGKDRQGTPERVQALSFPFTVEYLPKRLMNHRPVSSAWIREALQAGNLALVRQLLGRPYSILTPLSNQEIDLRALCAPPAGRYPVLIRLPSQTDLIPATALIAPDGQRLEITSPLTSAPLIEVIFSF